MRALRMLCAVIAIFAQLAMVAGGVMDGKAGASARPHVEETGTHMHRAHCEDACLVCAAQHAGACPSQSTSLLVLAIAPSGLHPRADELLNDAATFPSTQPRAPPFTN